MIDRGHIDPELIVDVYYLKQRGYSQSQICEETNISRSQVNSVFRHLPKYLNGKFKLQKRKESNYLDAVRIIKQAHKESRATERSQATHKPSEAPHVTALRETYQAFEKSAQEFVQKELAIRQEALLQENQELREEIEQLQSRLQQRSWIDELGSE